jgi:hypothetical protein
MVMHQRVARHLRSCGIVGFLNHSEPPLEPAHVAIEDMNDRIVELARANEELADKLQ